MSAAEDPPDPYHRALKRGAFFNLLGTLAKLVQPFTVLAITWLWGPAVMGLYLLAQSLMEVVSGGITAGYTDATTVFGSRHADAADGDPEHRRALYRVLSNTFVLTAGMSLLVVLATHVVGKALIDSVFSRYRELLPGLHVLAWALVPRSIGLVAIAATKAKMHMEHDALLYGLVHPLSMLGGCLVAYVAGGGLTALFAVQLVVDTAVCLLSLRAFSRYFSPGELLSHVLGFRFDGQLLGFAIPQTLNLTFNRYIARLDGIMLASFGLGQTELGYFGTAALLTSNLSQIRLVFSGALAPVVARHHAEGDRLALKETLSRVARWTTSLVVPAILLSLVLRRDVMHLVSHSYGENSLFVAVLLIPPFTNCAYGMAGAYLMFTGHTRVTLANSFCVALLNTAFTYVLIPRYGMLGAAVATALATSMTMGLQMVELYWLERVTIAARAVWKPHAGLLLGLLALSFVWDPVERSFPFRIATALALLVGYVGLMLALRHEELMGLLRRRIDHAS